MSLPVVALEPKPTGIPSFVNVHGSSTYGIGEVTITELISEERVIMM